MPAVKPARKDPIEVDAKRYQELKKFRVQICENLGVPGWKEDADKALDNFLDSLI